MAKINKKKSPMKTNKKNKTNQSHLSKLFQKFHNKTIDQSTEKKSNNLVFNPKLNELIDEQCQRIEPKKIQTLVSQTNEMWKKNKAATQRKKNVRALTILY